MPQQRDYLSEHIKEKYADQAKPEPNTVTGRNPDGSMDFLQESVQQHGGFQAPTQVHGEYDKYGQFVGDIGRLWDEYDEANPPVETPGFGRHRMAVSRAFQENLRRGGMLGEFGQDIPPVEAPENAWYNPLEMLSQLQRGQFAVVGGLKGILDGPGGEDALKNFYRGLLLKEEHSVGDILDKYDLLQDEPGLKFLTTLGGDILLDPLTWFTFGASGAARAGIQSTIKGFKGLSTAESGLKAALTGQGFKKLGSRTTIDMTADDLRKVLGNWGKKALNTAIDKVGEDAAIHAVVIEIANKTKIGTRLLPHGLRYQHWVPKIGGRSIGDLAESAGQKLGLKGTGLTPGGIVQRIDDLDATQSILNKMSEALAGTSIGKLGTPLKTWFGKAFVPFYTTMNKYPELKQMHDALRAGNMEEFHKLKAKGREFAKMASPEERKIIEELLDDPTKIGGKHFVTLRQTQDEVWADINMDYYEHGTKLTEDHANDLVDLYFEMMNEAFKYGHGEDLAFMGRGGRRGRSHVGVGAKGEVVSPKRLAEIDYMQPIFQAVLNAKSSKRFVNFKFGDWVIKLPTSPTRTRGIQNISARRGGNKAVGISELDSSSLLREYYFMRKMGDAPYNAGGHVVWRRISDIAPDSRGSLQEMSSGSRPFDHYFTFDDAVGRGGDGVQHPILLTGEAKQTAIEGGYWLHQREAARIGQKPMSKSQWYKSVKDKPIHARDLPQAILVKKFVPGKTIAELNTAMIARARDLTDNELTETTAKTISSVWKTINNVSKHGIAVGDLHGGNIMIHEYSGVAVAMDSNHFTDFAAEVPRFSPVGETNVIARGDLRGGNIEAPRAGFHISAEQRQLALLNKPVDEVVITDTGQLASNYVRALESNLKSSTNQGGLVTRMISDHGKALRLKHAGDSEAIERGMLKLFQQLKESGVIKSYKQGGYHADEVEKLTGIRSHDAVSNFNLRSAHGGIQRTDALPSNSTDHYGVLYNWDEPFKPITKKTLHKEARTWDEQVEILTSQHPGLENMSKQQYERVMRAYDFANEWKGLINSAYKAKGHVSPDRVRTYLKSLSVQRGQTPLRLNEIAELRRIDSPFDLVQRLKLAGEGKVQIPGLSEKEAGLFAEQVAKKFGMKLWNDDIAAVMTMNAIDVFEANGKLDMIDTIAKQWGKTVSEFRTVTKIVDGTAREVTEPVAEAGYMLMKHPLLDGVQIPEEVGKYLSQYSKAIFSDDATRTFFKGVVGYDSILNLWKGHATYVNLGFHGRNFMSNLFQLYLKDGASAISYTAHRDVIRALRGKEGSFKIGAQGQEITYDQFMDMAKRHNVHGTGWTSTDIESIAADVADVKNVGREGSITGQNVLGGAKEAAKTVGRAINPASQGNIGFRAGRKVGSTIENEARLVGFYNDLVRTGNEMYAAQRTKKFLFDYNDITHFEKQVMKRIFPFYTWMRKNVELQFEQMMKQPGKYGNIERFKHALEQASPEHDPRWAPKYFPEIYAIRTPLKSSKGSPVYWNPNLPFQDLGKAFDARDWLSSLAPWKVFGELITNTNIFSDSKIEKYEGELAPIEWLSSIQKSDNRLAMKIADIIGAAQVYEPETEKWIWSIPAKMKYAIEQASPFLRNVDQLGSFALGDVASFREERRPYDAVSRLFGAKFIPHNIKANFERTQFERRDMLRDLVKSKQKQGQLPSADLPEDKLPPH